MRSPNVFVASLCSRICVCAWLLLPAYATAEPPAHFNPVIIDVEGQSGVWFPTAEAERLLDVVDHELPAAKEVIALEQQRADLLKKQVRTATTALALTSSIAQANERMAAEIWRAYNDEVANRRSITRQPALWLATGAAGATAVIITVLQLLK